MPIEIQIPTNRESCNMTAHRKFSIVNRAPVIALLFLLFIGFRPHLVAQAKGPAPVFRPALAEIQSKVRIPILLPSKLPSAIADKDIKLASGQVRDDGYYISLYFSEGGGDATFAAGFGGSTRLLSPQDLPNVRRVAVSGGRTGMFRPVWCGGSCAPANLWWQQNGVMYQIQIKLGSRSAERDQEKILVETANSMVTARRD